MTEVRYKNLYDALITHKKYCKLIEGYGRRKVSFEDANLELLQTIHAGFLLTQIMDEYFVKVDCDITSKLIPEKVKELVKEIAIYNGSGYTLGDLMYKDEYTVLEKVRNKLAHGDFIIRNREIIFEEHGVEGRVNINKFLKLVYALETEAKKNTLEEPCKKVLNKVFEPKDITSIESEEDMDVVCKNLYRIELEEVPIPPEKRDLRYIKFIEEKYNKFIAKMEELSLEELEIYLETLKARFLKKGIELKFSIKNVKDLEKSFDFEKYKRNFNIVTYIRNAIAHGNVYIDSYETNIMETDIIFKDDYNGKMVYEKKIKVKDFIRIFEANNVNYIQSFYLNNIENKLFVDADTKVLEKDAHLIKK